MEVRTEVGMEVRMEVGMEVRMEVVCGGRGGGVVWIRHSRQRGYVVNRSRCGENSSMIPGRCRWWMRWMRWMRWKGAGLVG